jgi:glycosyltransferase involved in cell wall biosynthesis
MPTPAPSTDAARPIRLGYLVSHPIQYQAPLLRRIAHEPGIDLTVFFCSDFSVREYVDEGFGKSVTWDVPLLGGYRHEFLPALDRASSATATRPVNYGLMRRLQELQIDVLWVHGYARLYNLVAIASAHRAGVKVLLRDEPTLISSQRGLTKRLVKRAFFAQLKAWCDGYLPIGTLNRAYYKHYGIPDDKLFLMPYTVDNGMFRSACEKAAATREQFRAELALDRSRPVILFASKLIERKRCIDLLDAYTALSREQAPATVPYLLIVGDGELRAGLESRAKELGLDHVRFLGFKNQTELPRLYNLCDVFVLPSVDEPWGLVVNEAMNAGRAIIVSDRVGSGPDLVKHGVNGCVFPARDVNALRGALATVLRDPETTRRMGAESIGIIDGWSFEEDVEGLRAALASVY